MPVLTENIKFYRCVAWAEGDSHGGDVDLNAEIISGEGRNIFDDVLDVERKIGKIEYRKIYVRNENEGEGSSWADIKLWISQFTPALNDEISISIQGDNLDTRIDAENYNYVQPDSKDHADILSLGMLATNQYKHFWIKRTVSAGGDGYLGNGFKLALESS